MSKKQDLKRPDQFQAELIKGFQWTTAHSKAVLGAIAVFVVGGAIFGVTNYVHNKTENTAQEKYSGFEKQYTEKKMGFDQAAAGKDPKKNPPAVPATGDLQQDYGSIVAGFEDLVKESPNSRAAEMAALNLSEIYTQYKKPEEAMRVLKAVEPGLGHSDMLNSLVWMQMGSLLADQNKCNEAVVQWQKIVDGRHLEFAHDEAKLRMAVCYESMNNLTKAEELYTEVSKKDEKNADMNAARDAEKYLRLLKMKKNLTGSGS